MESRWKLSKIARNGKPPAMKASKICIDTIEETVKAFSIGGVEVVDKKWILEIHSLKI